VSQLPRKLTRTERAIKKACPKCGAEKGAQCTRTQPSFLAQERQHYTPAALANLAKMGQPLERPHNERFHALPDNPQARWEKQQARVARAQELAEIRAAARNAILRDQGEPSYSWKRRQVRALLMQQAMEKRFTRFEMLVRFFANHGDIFQEPTR
jgi:hypothetical protein